MDPASEELERRSRYLSSLIRRTKLTAVPTPLPPTPSPQPDTKLELELERERSPVRRAKLSPAPAPPPSTPHPEPETKLELEPRSRKLVEVEAKAVVEKRDVQDGDEKGKAKGKEERKVSVRVRAADMPVALQRRAVRLAYDAVAATPRVDGKRLALALKKVQTTPISLEWFALLSVPASGTLGH
jgi:dynein light chain LC8-type